VLFAQLNGEGSTALESTKSVVPCTRAVLIDPKALKSYNDDENDSMMQTLPSSFTYNADIFSGFI
jgi:hypothetical protein